MPTSSSLVTNLPADFNTFGQGVDTSLQDLLGGTTGQVLSKTSATNMDFTWVTPTDQTPLTTKGDLFTFTTVDARLGVGTDGQVLTASSVAATGLTWATPTAGMTNPMTTTGDMIYSSSGSTPARRGIGSTGQVLTVSGGIPVWSTPAASGTAIAGSYATVATQESTTSTSFVDLTTSGPAVTVTTGTRALVIVGATQRSTVSGAQSQMSFAVSGATTRAVQTNEWTSMSHGSTTVGVAPANEAAILVTGLTAGSNVFTAKYAAPAGDSVSFQYRKITVIDLGS